MAKARVKFLTYAGSKAQGIWWIRILGYGFQLKAPWAFLLFSERNGYTKTLVTVQGWRLRYLRRGE